MKIICVHCGRRNEYRIDHRSSLVLQFFTNLPRLVEVQLEGDREGNIFVTWAGKKMRSSFINFLSYLKIIIIITLG